MAYVTFEQFELMYGDEGLTAEQFPMYATAASGLIDSITRYIIPRCGGISRFPQWVQDAVRQAAGAQVLYFTQNGFETVLTGESGQGFTVGKVHVDGKSTAGGAGGNTAAQSMISPLAVTLLEQTGLMGRCTPCYDPYRNSFLGIW